MQFFSSGFPRKVGEQYAEASETLFDGSLWPPQLLYLPSSSSQSKLQSCVHCKCAHTSLGNAECNFKAVAQSRAVWWYLQNIEEISFSESLSPWTLLWAHRTGLGANPTPRQSGVSWLGEDAWSPAAPAHESQVSDCMLARKPSWTEAHAGLHKKLHRLHEQTYFFPPVKTKVKTEQNHPDLSIPLLLYILNADKWKRNWTVTVYLII